MFLRISGSPWNFTVICSRGDFFPSAGMRWPSTSWMDIRNVSSVIFCPWFDIPYNVRLRNVCDRIASWICSTKCSTITFLCKEEGLVNVSEGREETCGTSQNPNNETFHTLSCVTSSAPWKTRDCMRKERRLSLSSAISIGCFKISESAWRLIVSSNWGNYGFLKRFIAHMLWFLGLRIHRQRNKYFPYDSVLNAAGKSLEEIFIIEFGGIGSHRHRRRANATW